MKTLLLFLLCSASLFAQVDTVKVNDHVILTNDLAAALTISEFYFTIDNNQRIAYSEKLQQLKGVYVIDAPKEFIAKIEDDTIYIGSYANQFPYTKRILILNRLAVHHGARQFGGSHYSVLNREFVLNDRTEAVYASEQRRKYKVDINYILKELEKVTPLKTRI